MEAPVFSLTKTTFRIAGVVPARPVDDAEDVSPWPVFDEPYDAERLFVDGVELSIAPSQQIRHHSREFSWGYAGSGPAQTALAICLHIFGNRHVAEALYQAFKEEFVVNWQPVGQPFNVQIDVADFLIDHRGRLQQALEWEEWEVQERAFRVHSDRLAAEGDY